MKRLNYLVKGILLGTVIVLIAGCTSETPITPTPKTNPISKSLGDMIPFQLPDSVNNDNLVAYVRLNKNSLSQWGSLGTQVTVTYSSQGLFQDEQKNYIDAGDLTLESQIVDGAMTENDDYVYSAHFEFGFTGNNYNWQISGNDNFPACSISVPSPSSEVEIQYPIAGRTLNIKDSISIEWDSDYNSENSVKLVVKTPYTNTTDKSIKYKEVIRYPEDNGKFTFVPGELDSLDLGSAFIDLYVGKFAIKECKPGKYIYGTVFSFYEVSCSLTKTQ